MSDPWEQRRVRQALPENTAEHVRELVQSFASVVQTETWFWVRCSRCREWLRIISENDARV